MDLACQSEAVLKYCDLLAELEKVKQENESLKQQLETSKFKPLSLNDQMHKSRNDILNYSGLSLNDQLIEYRSNGRIIQFPPWYLQSVGLDICGNNQEGLRRLVKNSQDLLFVYYDILWCILHNKKLYCVYVHNSMSWSFSFTDMHDSLKFMFPSLNLKTMYVSSYGGECFHAENPQGHFRNSIISCDITWT